MLDGVDDGERHAVEEASPGFPWASAWSAPRHWPTTRRAPAATPAIHARIVDPPRCGRTIRRSRPESGERSLLGVCLCALRPPCPSRARADAEIDAVAVAVVIGPDLLVFDAAPPIERIVARCGGRCVRPRLPRCRAPADPGRRRPRCRPADAPCTASCRRTARIRACRTAARRPARGGTRPPLIGAAAALPATLRAAQREAGKRVERVSGHCGSRPSRASTAARGRAACGRP